MVGIRKSFLLGAFAYLQGGTLSLIKHGDIPASYVSLPEGIRCFPVRFFQENRSLALQSHDLFRGSQVICHSRWAPSRSLYKWSYGAPYTWPYKWVTGVVTLLIRVITPVITAMGPTMQVKQLLRKVSFKYTR